jgi:hypothetical protein
MKIAVFLVNFYQTTRCYNPEDSNLHTHRRKNLKSYLSFFIFAVYRFNSVSVKTSSLTWST